jgi:hypothetical protein
LLAQQQRLLQQQGRGGMVSAQPNLMPTVQNPTETQARPRNTRMQADMSTAAAFVALQNAQNATKIVLIVNIA